MAEKIRSRCALLVYSISYYLTAPRCVRLASRGVCRRNVCLIRNNSLHSHIHKPVAPAKEDSASYFIAFAGAGTRAWPYN